jgi:exopolysaccharide biosynthesis polyprenyl glycosylphosphotransferase
VNVAQTVAEAIFDILNRRDAVARPDAVPAFFKRRKKRADELGQLLLENGTLEPESLRNALRAQDEQGGQLGAILVEMGACAPRAVADAIIEQATGRRAHGDTANAARLARANPAVVGLKVLSRPRLTSVAVFAADAAAVFAGSMLGSLGVLGAHAVDAACWVRAAVVTPLCLFAYSIQHLYDTPPPRSPDEIRRVAYSTSLVCVVLIASSVIGPASVTASNAALLAGWGLGIALVLFLRGAMRRTLGRTSWWGRPVVVLGAGKTGRVVVRTLQTHPELGLRPVAILDDDPSKHGTLHAAWGTDDIQVESVRSRECAALEDCPSCRCTAFGQFSQVEGVPIIGLLNLAPTVAQRLRIQTAVLALDDLHAPDLEPLMERVTSGFKTVLVVPERFSFDYVGDPTRNLGGVLGIEIRQQLLLTWPRICKRTMDLVLTLVGGLLILPVLGLLALIVAVDSPGAVFYRQKRLGLNGQRFEALKFRTMYGDGERRLRQILESDPTLGAEYEQFHKLTVDPRVTRVGRVLRKYSLDELPQIVNVLLGDMSLVGPRPYLERESPQMEGKERIILRARPGITGLWQVSDRNSTTFRSRLSTDVEYVRNWSPWLDLSILIRTALVVAQGTGE